MKWSFWLILILIFMISCVYAEVSPRFDSLLLNTADLGRLNTDSDTAKGDDDITLKKIKRQVNFAIQQVCQDFPAIEKYDTIFIDSAMEGGTLPSDFSRVINVDYIADEVTRIPIFHIMEGDSIAKKDGELVQNRQNPTDTMGHKGWRVHAGLLEVHPKWRRGDTATYLLQYYALDSNLTLNASVTQVRSKYRDKIWLFAISRLWGMRSNLILAEYWMKEYERGLVKDND